MMRSGLFFKSIAKTFELVFFSVFAYGVIPVQIGYSLSASLRLVTKISSHRCYIKTVRCYGSSFRKGYGVKSLCFFITIISYDGVTGKIFGKWGEIDQFNIFIVFYVS